MLQYTISEKFNMFSIIDLIKVNSSEQEHMISTPFIICAVEVAHSYFVSDPVHLLEAIPL